MQIIHSDSNYAFSDESRAFKNVVYFERKFCYV